jgi:LmbE family N-acetylglucosaminyl deacetylase
MFLDVAPFTALSRLLLIAPHPDDESVACSVTLQRAVQAGSATRVVYATDGGNNPWPQRFLERRWRLDEADRRNWGRLRRQEAIDALSVMGISRDDVQFLELPDQGLTDLLMDDPEAVIEIFSELITDWSPTHLMIPALADTHPDHNAVAAAFHLVLQNLPPKDLPGSILSFVVHGKNVAPLNGRIELEQTAQEAATKRAAIECHETQLMLSRRRFLAYADRPESFGINSSNGSSSALTRVTLRTPDHLELELQPPRMPIFQKRPRLMILGLSPFGEPVTACHDVENRLRLKSRSGRGKIEIPTDMFSAADGLLIKLDRRTIFFDVAGWLEVPPATLPAQRNLPDLEGEPVAA